jgi:hypothetical protein
MYSLLMLLALAWLTVCLPYVNESHQLVKTQIQITDETPDTDVSNPLSNTNEEKAQNGPSLLSEYLHHPFSLEHNFIDVASLFKGHSSALYLAFHPEMIIPPPEA